MTGSVGCADPYSSSKLLMRALHMCVAQFGFFESIETVVRYIGRARMYARINTFESNTLHHVQFLL